MIETAQGEKCLQIFHLFSPIVGAASMNLPLLYSSRLFVKQPILQSFT